LRWFAIEPERKPFYKFPGARARLGWAEITSEGAYSFSWASGLSLWGYG
jgi:hypothetical protein